MTTTMTMQAKEADRPEGSRSSPLTLAHYMSLEYPIDLVRDGDEYVASHPDLPGCTSFGGDPNSAVENLSAVKKLWIEGQLESGNEIPEPTEEEDYSGKFVLRIPRALHRMADHRARSEGVSLNSFISAVLSGALGFPGSQVVPRYHGLGSVHGHRDRLHMASFDPESVWFEISSHVSQKGHFWVNKGSMLFLDQVAEQIGSHQRTAFTPPLKTEDYFHAKEKRPAAK